MKGCTATLNRCGAGWAEPMRVWILRHVSFEGPGAIAPWLERRGAVIERCELFRGDPLPQPGSSIPG